ncbi:MAG: lipoyl(octanoyl) transferase LipB [Gemmatimonadales bacterium]
MTPIIGIVDLGRRDYHDALALQRAARLARLDGRLGEDLLLLVEHDPVYTLGRGTQAASLPIAPEALREHGADVIEIERGGDVTWHGPGQLVGYPILDLRQHREDLHWYLRTIEAALIGALARLGIPAGRVAGKTGVWTGGRKIASIGVHVKQWITLHGFALNVHPDLGWFQWIVPCGIHGVEMTSVRREIGADPADADLWRATSDAVVAEFAAAFDRRPEPRPIAELEAAIASATIPALE